MKGKKSGIILSIFLIVNTYLFICFQGARYNPIAGATSSLFRKVPVYDNPESIFLEFYSGEFSSVSENKSLIIPRPTDTMIYNVLTGRETWIASHRVAEPELPLEAVPLFDLHHTSDEIAALVGQEPTNITFKTIFLPDGRTKVSPTTSFPWSSIVKLYITAADDTNFIGSGAIIDKFHVLTCGHCVYIHDHGGWAKSIKVVPGMNNGLEPFGHAWVTNMRTYGGWVLSEDFRHDWAVLTLDQNIGQSTGWMGCMTVAASSLIYTGILNTAGYPGDLDSGLNMYSDSNNGKNADEYNHWFYMDVASGQSGSPVWIFQGGTDRYILSIVASGGAEDNRGTRLNQDKFDSLVDWLNLDSKLVPDLRDRGTAYAGFSPKVVNTSTTLFDVWCGITNNGNGTSGSFTVSYYASNNTIITKSDYLLGTDTITSIAAGSSSSSFWLSAFPSNIPNGQYYIGWIIDSGNSISEVREDNNINYIDSYQLSVEKLSTPGPDNDLLVLVFIFVLVVIVAAALMGAFVRRRYGLQDRTILEKKGLNSQLMAALDQVDPQTKLSAIYGMVEADQTNILSIPDLTALLSLVLRLEAPNLQKEDVTRLLSMKITQQGKGALPFLKSLLQGRDETTTAVVRRIIQDIQLHQSLGEFRLQRKGEQNAD